jgi:ankyrin repeat protein
MSDQASAANIEIGHRLIHAAKAGDKHTVAQILAQVPRDFWALPTALLVAATDSTVAALDVLLETGTTQKDRNEALEHAARDGQIAALKTLLRHGADPRAPDALSNAAQFNHVGAIQILLAAGADVNAGDDMALFSAAVMGAAQAAAALIAAGAGGIALALEAAQQNKNTDTVEVLQAALDRKDI